MAKKNLFGLRCACCGSDITAPQFYKGQMYGYTCITKVAPKQKKNKVYKMIYRLYIIILQFQYIFFQVIFLAL